MAEVSPRRQHAQALFAPLGPTYDRYAALLSFGQDPRWRRFLVSRVGAGPGDTVLDVACGPGLMACAFARVALHVTGIDLTPAMIEQAKVMQQSDGLSNLTWHVGDAQPLPFADASFSLVFTRYSKRLAEEL